MQVLAVIKWKETEEIVVWQMVERNMKLLIFGSVGSGKSTLARQLSEKYNIPCFEGDSICHGFEGEERRKRSDEEQQEIIRRIDRENENWIVEGVYRESQKSLWDLAEKILFLDTPLSIRYFRIIRRFIRQKLGREACNYKPTFKIFKYMFKWTKDFEANRPMYEEMLEERKEKVIWVKKVEAETLWEQISK